MMVICYFLCILYYKTSSSLPRIYSSLLNFTRGHKSEVNLILNSLEQSRVTIISSMTQFCVVLLKPLCISDYKPNDSTTDHLPAIQRGYVNGEMFPESFVNDWGANWAKHSLHQQNTGSTFWTNFSKLMTACFLSPLLHRNSYSSWHGSVDGE